MATDDQKAKAIDGSKVYEKMEQLQGYLNGLKSGVSILNNIPISKWKEDLNQALKSYQKDYQNTIEVNNTTNNEIEFVEYNYEGGTKTSEGNTINFKIDGIDNKLYLSTITSQAITGAITISGAGTDLRRVQADTNSTNFTVTEEAKTLLSPYIAYGKNFLGVAGIYSQVPNDKDAVTAGVLAEGYAAFANGGNIIEGTLKKSTIIGGNVKDISITPEVEETGTKYYYNISADTYFPEQGKIDLTASYKLINDILTGSNMN